MVGRSEKFHVKGRLEGVFIIGGLQYLIMGKLEKFLLEIV